MAKETKAKIHNPTIRMFHLPEIDGEQPERLDPNGTIECSPGYLKALVARKKNGKPSGWGLRLEVKGSKAMVREPVGVAGAFAARIKGKRKSEKAAADKKANGSNEATKARLEALENEAVSKGASAEA